MIGKKEPVFRGRLENLPSAAAALTSSHDGSRRDSGIFLFFRSFNHGGDDIKNNIILCVFIW